MGSDLEALTQENMLLKKRNEEMQKLLNKKNGHKFYSKTEIANLEEEINQLKEENYALSEKNNELLEKIKKLEENSGNIAKVFI